MERTESFLPPAGLLVHAVTVRNAATSSFITSRMLPPRWKSLVVFNIKSAFRPSLTPRELLRQSPE